MKMEKFWKIKNISSSIAEIMLYGEILESTPINFWTDEAAQGMYASLENFLAEFELIKNIPEINVRINSVGGDVFAGITIHNLLKNAKAKINVIVEGVALSAAFIISQAGDTIKVFPGSVLMGHQVSTLLYGFYSNTDLQSVINSNDALENSLIEILNLKSQIDKKELKKMLQNEFWMTGQEAINKGFADELISDSNIELQFSNAQKLLVVNGVKHDMNSFDIPKKIRQGFSKLKTNSIKALNLSNEDNQTNDEPNTEGEIEMEIKNVNDLKTNFPEFVKEIELSAQNSAVLAERKRLENIEKIAVNISDKKVLNEARYGEKVMTAEELAFIAMQNEAELNKSHLQNMQADYQQSNVQNVNALPNNGNQQTQETDEEKHNKLVANAVNLIKKGGTK